MDRDGDDKIWHLESGEFTRMTSELLLQQYFYDAESRRVKGVTGFLTICMDYWPHVGVHNKQPRVRRQLIG